VLPAVLAFLALCLLRLARRWIDGGASAAFVGLTCMVGSVLGGSAYYTLAISPCVSCRCVSAPLSLSPSGAAAPR
jgi:hypothetical protein